MVERDVDTNHASGCDKFPLFFFIKIPRMNYFTLLVKD